jgi:hypothetical protein
MNTQPPRIATWLLRHFGSSPNNDVVIGDLNERYQQGRSRLWYWRQAVAAIVVSFFTEVWSHKLLTIWAMYIGWGIFWISRYGLILTRELLLGSRYWTSWPIWMSMTGQTIETVISGIVAGWFVALLSRESRKAMVLAYALSLEAIPFCLEAIPFCLAVQQQLVDGEPVYAIRFFTGVFPIFTLTAMGAIFGGGIFAAPKKDDSSGRNRTAVS